MSEHGVGRVLIASLHQAIADVLPMRLAFYEHWLHASGLRDGTIGLAQMYAVLSFLRGEGEAYTEVMTRAGACAAEWTVSSMSPLGRRLIATTPPAMRRRLLLRRAGRLVRTSYAGSSARSRITRGTARIELSGSLFCAVRERVPQPLCRYYAAMFERMLALFEMPVTVEVVSCRGTGAQTCSLRVPFSPAAAAEEHA